MNVAIILLAGKGKRFSNTKVKNLSLINNKHLFRFVADTCLKNKSLDKIILVINKNIKAIVAKEYAKNKKISIVIGSNNSRHDSLINGINYISKKLKSNDIIVTLDGDRVFVTNELINKSIKMSSKHGYSCANIKLVDAIVNVNSNNIKYLSRDNVNCIQTPQAIQYKYWSNNKKIGNDLFSSLNLKLNKRNLFEGSPLNFKITFKEDLELANKIKFNSK